MAVVVGELRVLELRVQARDVLQEFRVAPLAADRRLLGIALENLPRLVVRGVLLLLRPHVRGVRLVVPHDRAVVGVHEHVGLVHVADHALRRGDGARELVADRVAGAPPGDGRVLRRLLSRVPVLRVDARMLLVAVVGVHRVAGAAARGPVVAGLLVGAEEPQVRVVQARLGDVDHRHRDAASRAGAAVGLLEVGPARLVQALQDAGVVGQADLGEERGNHAPAALEDPEDVGRRNRLPRRQRRDARQDSLRDEEVGGLHRVHERGADALARVGLAEDVALVREDPVVVGRPAPEHGRGRHEAALGGLDDREVAGAAGLAGDAQVARIDEADVLGRLAVQERVAALGVRARGPLPSQGVARQHVGPGERFLVGGVLALGSAGLLDRRVASVAVRAAELHRGVLVHRVAVRRGVAAHAPVALRPGLAGRLALRRRRVGDVRARHGLLRSGVGPHGEREGDGGQREGESSSHGLCRRAWWEISS